MPHPNLYIAVEDFTDDESNLPEASREQEQELEEPALDRANCLSSVVDKGAQ